MPIRPLSLADERSDALDHGLALIRDAWTGFDAARPMEPPISREQLRLDDPLPERGEGVVAALDAASLVLDQSLAQTRPRFFAYVGSSGLESAVLADALAHSYDVNLAGESGAAHEIERQCLRWVGEFVGFPAAGGAFTSGGMLSNLTALTAARTRRLPDSREDGMSGVAATVYASAEAHSSIERAVEVLGFGRRSLRSVPIDDRRRMQVDVLHEMVAEDVRAGRTPVAVVATAGSTLTGAVDPLDRIADVCAEHGIWMHIDGAYGLPAASTDVARDLFVGLDRADSAALDAHKWMFVPKACGVLLVREQDSLFDAFEHEASYLVDHEDYRHPVDGTLEYSRPFRPLKLWTALRAHGAEAFREAITRDIELARELEEQVRRHPRLELMVESSPLSIIPFRRIPAQGDIDEHNHRLGELMQADGRVYVAGAVLDGKSCLRPCFVNFRTTSDDVRALVDIADELGAQLESSMKGSTS